MTECWIEISAHLGFFATQIGSFFFADVYAQPIGTITRVKYWFYKLFKIYVFYRICKPDISVLIVTKTLYISFYVIYITGLKMAL